MSNYFTMFPSLYVALNVTLIKQLRPLLHYQANLLHNSSNNYCEKNTAMHLNMIFSTSFVHLGPLSEALSNLHQT